MAYKLNPGLCTEDLLKNGFKTGSWRHIDSEDEWHSKWWPLYEEMDLTIHINMTTKEWNEFDGTDVIDGDFGQPYGPFYDCVYNKAQKFGYVEHVIAAYYKRMDALVDSGILIKV